MNNDPVSGLMTSMNRVRNQRPGSVAQGEIAASAGTLPTIVPTQTTPPRIKPTDFTQVLPVPQETPPVPVSAPIDTVPTTDITPEEQTVIRTTRDMMGGEDMSLADAYVLSLGYLFGVSKPTNPTQLAGQNTIVGADPTMKGIV